MQQALKLQHVLIFKCVSPEIKFKILRLICWVVRIIEIVEKLFGWSFIDVVDVGNYYVVS